MKNKAAKSKAEKKTKGKNRKAWLGVGLAALAAGAVVGLTGGWPFKGLSGGAAGSSTDEDAGSGSRTGAGTQAGTTADESGASAGGGATADVDVALTNEVARSTKPKPGDDQNFTNEGGTGNND
ncbi:hypothetical protein GCM10023185_20170 [Hymenobacter saemangeumensis]|uniref:YtxH domain-containing protein n=1 Tax=Hymenobacter saemangeumensis TaxID=1084522 RepID=A0ABP8IDQ1_9BACT